MPTILHGSTPFLNCNWGWGGELISNHWRKPPAPTKISENWSTMMSEGRAVGSSLHLTQVMKRNRLSLCLRLLGTLLTISQQALIPGR